MKRLLIISPHFPPTNAADMQRVRMSLPYYSNFGWEAEVVVVAAHYNDMVKDPLLLQSIPDNIVVHQVKAFSKKYTAKVGLGSLALRSLYFYKKKVDALLKAKKFDLIYFSTTEFPVCILGPHWTNKFGIPYVIDMQDPWHSEFYQDKPKHERPKKYWFSYRLHKFLEPIAMKSVAGLTSVSAAYIKTLADRYPDLINRPNKVITFGAFDKDFEIAARNDDQLELVYDTNSNQTNLVYIGRGGYDMQQAVSILFEAFRRGLSEEPELFNQVHFHFIGTSYAPKGQGTPTIKPIAEKMGLEPYVSEHTDRIGFYQNIKNLSKANGLLVIGSNDAGYNASKLYPYLMAKKPLLVVFHHDSAAAKLIKACKGGDLITFDQNIADVYLTLKHYIQRVKDAAPPETDWKIFAPYTAKSLTKEQVDLFDRVILKQ